MFQPFLFNANSVREHFKKSKLTGTWAETVDIFSCATLLQCTVFTFSLVWQLWLKSEPLFNNYTSNSMSANKAKRCLCPISLLLVYFYANVCSKMYYHRPHSPWLASFRLPEAVSSSWSSGILSFRFLVLWTVGWWWSVLFRGGGLLLFFSTYELYPFMYRVAWD